MHDYRQLQVWRRAHRFCLDIYDATRSFPASERYGLTSQIRRASVSIEVNIAEGSGAGSDVNFARFLQHSIASSTELECELLLSRDLGLLGHERHDALHRELGEVRGMLMSLSSRLRSNE